MRLRYISLILLLSTILYAKTGEELFNTYCYKCHANILGITNDGGYDNSYITVAPYIKELVKKLKNKTKTKVKFQQFITDYIQNPDKRKSLYGKKAIKKFGLMPSLNGAMSPDEIAKLTDYLYNYNNEEKPKVVKQEVKKSLSYEEKLFNNNCAMCHAKILGVTNDGGYENSYITPAPYVTDLLAKLRKMTHSKEEFVNFISDYIRDPHKRKSLYGKRAIKKFGLMPSLKDKISKEDAKRLAQYLYEYNPY